MKDTHIALIGGALSWVILVGGAVGVPMTMVGMDKAAHQRTLDQRGMTADVAAAIGDVATLKIPKGFKVDPVDQEPLTPELHTDPDAVNKTWQLAQRKPAPWDIAGRDNPPPPAATLFVIISDPLSNAMEMQRLDFEDPPFATVGPIALLKAPAMVNEYEDMPTGVRYVAQNAAAGFSAELTLADATLYSDEQARNLLVSVLGSLQVTPSKLDAVLAGPRQRQAEEMAAREQMIQANVERVSELLGLKEQPDGARTSPFDDVLIDNVLYIKLDTRKAKAGADPMAVGFKLTAPMSEDMATLFGEQDENMLGLWSISRDNRGYFFSGPVLSAEYVANSDGEPPATEPFNPPPQLAQRLKPGEVSLWRFVHLDYVSDAGGADQLDRVVSQSIDWRKEPVKKWAAK